MARRKASAKQKEAGWIQRFPWCRGCGTYDSLWGPTLTAHPGGARYPMWLEGHQLMVEEERLLNFLRLVWAVDISRSDLNALEYYGLVIPARKAFVRSLEPRLRRIPVEGGEECHWPTTHWAHRGWSHSSRRRNNPEPEPLWHRTFGNTEDFRDHSVVQLRPSPVLVVGYDSLFMPKPHASELPPDDPRRDRAWARRIPQLEPERTYTASDLRARGLWWGPTDPRFWSALAMTDATLKDDKPLPVGLPLWLRELFGPTERNPLALSARQLLFTGHDVTRFYYIGGPGPYRASTHKASNGGFGNRFGQDWWVAQVIKRLKLRTSLDETLEIEGAMQRRSVNANRRLLDTLRERWERWGRNNEARLPPIVPSFHRNALLWLLHRSRPKGVSQLESLKALGRLAGLKPEAVRMAIHAGQRSLTAS